MGQEQYDRKERDEALLREVNFGAGVVDEQLAYGEVTGQDIAPQENMRSLSSLGGLRVVHGPKFEAGIETSLKDVMATLSRFLCSNLRAYSPIGFLSKTASPIDVSLLVSRLGEALAQFEERAFPSELSMRDGVDESVIASAASGHIEEVLSLLVDNRFEMTLSESEHEFLLFTLLGLREEIAELRFKTEMAKAQNRMNAEASKLVVQLDDDDDSVSFASLAALLPGGNIDQSFVRLQEILAGEYPSLQEIAQSVHGHARRLLHTIRGKRVSPLGFHAFTEDEPEWNTKELVQGLNGAVDRLAEIYFEAEGNSHYDVQLRSFAHSLMSYTEALLIKAVRSERDGGYPDSELPGLREAATRTIQCATDVTRQTISFIQELEEKNRLAS